MKTKSFIRFLYVCLVIPLHFSTVHRTVHAQRQPLELFRYSFIAGHFVTTFVPSSSTQWVNVQISSDLDSWTDLASVLSTRSSHLLFDENAQTNQHRFYITTAPGTTVEDARLLWAAKGITNYTFRFRSSSGSVSGLNATGRITVRDGEKSVTSVIDTDTGEAKIDFDPAHFPDIDELFVTIIATTTPGQTVDIRLTYDSVWRFPMLTRYTVGFPEWSRYEITEFQILDSPDSPQ